MVMDSGDYALPDGWTSPPQLECKRCHHLVFGLNRGLCYHCIGIEEHSDCNLPHTCPECGTTWGLVAAESGREAKDG